MRSGLQRTLATLLVTVCLGAPLLEMLDHWDHTLQDGNDTESNLVVVVLCIGACFIAATVMLRRLRPALTREIQRASSLARATLESVSLTPPNPHASPPLALRI